MMGILLEAMTMRQRRDFTSVRARYGSFWCAIKLKLIKGFAYLLLFSLPSPPTILNNQSACWFQPSDFSPFPNFAPPTSCGGGEWTTSSMWKGVF